MERHKMVSELVRSLSGLHPQRRERALEAKPNGTIKGNLRLGSHQN